MGAPARRDYCAFISYCVLWTILNAVAVKSEPCGPGLYQCQQEKTCIPELWRCDGHPDCRLADDEPTEECRSWKRIGQHRKGTVLTPRGCVPNQYRCRDDSRCVPIYKLCDGVPDCRKSDDESFECSNMFIDNSCASKSCPPDGGCKRSEEGPLCYCPEGYRVSDDSKACVDLNECLYEGFCDQTCKNSPGNYTCSCVDGYRLNRTDARTCEPVNIPTSTPATILYQTLNSLRQVALDGSTLAAPFSLAAKRIQTMDINHYDAEVCWIEMASQAGRSDTGSLYCAKLQDAGHRRQMKTKQALNNVGDMALDWVTKNWYFTDKVALRIVVCVFDGTKCRTLTYLENESPAQIRLDPLAGYLFLTTTGSSPKIMRMGLDGSGLITLVDKALTRPRGLTLDLANRHIYWSDNSFSRIQRVKYDGTGREVIISGSWVNTISSLSILGNWIYGADPATGKIIRFDRRQHDRSQDPVTVIDQLNYTAAIYVYHRQRQPVVGQQPCDQNKCDHFCVPAVSAQNVTQARCLCEEGWTADGNKCTASIPSSLILYSISRIGMVRASIPSSLILYSISRIGMVRGTDLACQGDVIAPIDGLDGPVALAVHVQEKMIYYSSVFHGKIGRRRLDGKNRNDSYITKGIRQSEGIAVDWIAGSLYWTDKVWRTISVCRLDNPDIRRVVVTEQDHFYPRSVTVDPVRKFLYWISWTVEDYADHQTKIMQARLDGSQPRVLSSSATKYQYWPNGFTLSDDGLKLYSVEAYYDNIQMIDLSKEPPTSQIIFNDSTVIKHPYSLSLAGDSLYWTEMTSMMRLNLTSMKTASIKSEGSGLFDIQAFNESGQPMKASGCGDCSDLCLRVGDKPCQCGVGRIPTTNPNTCVRDPTHKEAQCSQAEFKCGDGMCIDNSLKCNGVVDCADRSDEDRNTTCKNHKCPEADHMYQCTNNKCVPLRWLCDGEDDCQSGSLEDENPNICNKSSCPNDDYTRCKTSRRCIPKSWVCDLDYDCVDKSDEPDDCPQTQASCSPQQFHCDNKRCISTSFVCNQVDDCGDSSDESDCRYSCASTEFKCRKSGRCLPASYQCDGIDSCGDNSDEQDCAVKPTSGCTHNEFSCGSGDCIPLGWYCDSNTDCENGADEMNCTNADNSTGFVPCPAEGFGCVDLSGRHRCMSRHSLCDSIRDCKDGEDERDCDCPVTKFSCDENSQNRTRVCLDLDKVCDDTPDCLDHTDEGFLCSAKVCDNNAAQCSHMCHNTPTGYRCSCPAGNMTLDSDKHTCKVVEACGWGACSQLCEARGTESVCKCLPGFQLMENRFSCKPEDKRTPYIIFSNRHEIRRFDLGGSNYASLLSALPNTIALDFHYNHSFIFWTDVNEDAIYRGKMEGNSMSNVETIVRTGLAVTEGLAVDWLGDNIYWVESQLDQIEVARIDGSNQTTLIAGDMENPRAIALDPREGWLFWTDWHGSRPRIERCGMDGNNRSVIYDLNSMLGAGWPNGMTLDFDAKRVYWIDARSHSIHTIKYDGSDHRLVLKDQQLISHPFAISLYGDKVYWTDWKTNSLITANKWNGTSVTQVQRTITQPFDLQVYHSTRQPPGSNPCRNNGGCSHLCLISRSGVPTCKCPALMKMDNGKCVAETRFLVYGEENQIRGVDMDRPYYNVMPAMTSDHMKLGSLDLHIAENRYYWTDMETNTVKRSFINGSLEEIIINTNLTGPESLAVDWSSRVLYVTSYDHLGGAIHVSSLDGAYRIRLQTKTPLNHPVAITLMPEEGIMFVADVGLNKLFRYNMDGTDERVIATTGAGWQALSVDPVSKRVYWLSHQESGEGVIHSASLDGSTKYNSTSVDTGLYTVSVSGRYLYYSQKTPGSDRGVSNITRVSLASGGPAGEPEIVRSTDTATKAIRMWDAAEQPPVTSNPCAGNGGCGQLCLLAGKLNAQKRRVCRCTAGYTLGQDNQTCQAVRDNSSHPKSISPFLLYSTTSQIVGRELVTNVGRVALPPVSNISNVSAIDFNPLSESLFWVDSKTTEISRIQRDLTRRQAIVKTGPDIVEGLAVDWQAENVYWTDQAFGTIQVARTDGMYRYVLFSTDLKKPRSIVVHPDAGLLFWTDVGDGSASSPRVPRIERARLDGSQRQIIYNATDGQLPFSLAFDTGAGKDRLFWCDRLQKNIMSMDLLGQNVTVVRRNVSSCFHIAVKDNFVYWTTRETEGKIKKYGIQKADLDPNKVTDDVEDVISGVKDRITDLKIYSTPVVKDDNPCSRTSSARRNCSQLCFYNGTDASCACAYGKLANNSLDCVDRDAFLLFSSISRIESINMEDTDDRNQPIEPIQIPDSMKNVIGLAFHYGEKRVFFSDIYRRDIQQVYMDGTGIKVVAKNVGSAEGLAYDEVYNRLYWTSYTNSSIKSVDLDTGNTTGKVVVQLTEDDHPRAIVIDSCKSRMFWTNWNSKRPCIQRVFLQGWNVENIITTDIRVPNGLAIDHKGQRLYWSDARLDKIERCDFDGGNRKIIVSRVPQHVFALAQYGDYLYWTDWIMQSVVMASKFDGSIVKTLRKTEQQPMGIVAVAKDTNECSLNPCMDNNGGCSNICQIDDRGLVQCRCYGNKVLKDDRKTCISKCEGRDDFVCPSHGTCVPLELTCNGRNECSGGEDEAPDYCNTRLCPANYYRCHNNRCIQWHKVCDRRDDCGDGSDEQSCNARCSHDKMLCSASSIHCIDRSKRCDGHPDCPLGQDETHCNKTECPPKSLSGKDQPYLIPCNTTTACISPSWRCDGENDCWDKSDEENCEAESTCAAGDFQCKDDKRCISGAWKCDKTADCADQSDEVDCGFECSADEFKCTKSGHCINKMWVCDGQPDCEDRSDEHAGCKKVEKCKEDFFTCVNSSRCIPRTQTCDGYHDCTDRSDESPLYAKCGPRKCSSKEFQCSDGSCIQQHFKCDHYSDCEKGEDEQNCTYQNCTAQEFRCRSGQCIPLSGRCDGYPDCYNGWDEANETCQPQRPCPGQYQCKNGSCINEKQVCDLKNDCGDWSDELTCGINECNYNPCDENAVCVDKKLGYECQCNTGYDLQSDGRTCKDKDECSEQDLCSHYCMNTLGGYRCSCLKGFALEKDKRTCKPSQPPVPYFVITNRYYLRNVTTYGGASIITRSLINAVAVDYDWREQAIYWSDVTNHEANISKMFFNGTGRQVLHNTTLSNPDGIAVDWYGGNLYWCDKTTDTIEVSKTDGRFRKVLIKDNLQEPRALVVHPAKGYIFYTDWGDNAHIGRIGMDGTERKRLVTNDIGWPNALALDYVRDKIYWADARLDYIKMADLDGGNKRVVIKGNLPHVFALTVFGGDIYWTDWEQKAVNMANKLSGKKMTRVREFIHRPMDIHVVHPSRQMITSRNPCENNGGCKNLCLVTAGGGGRTCACPENHVLHQDGVSCTADCTSSQFLCRSSSKCIPFWTYCDRQNDCGDYSDEPPTCRPYVCRTNGLFQCHDAEKTRQCIPPSQICDGLHHCQDHSDELNCANYTCLPNQFTCEQDGVVKCIPESRRCDGVQDCTSGTDEHGCAKPFCEDNQIMCKEGGKSKCIPYMWKCDGANDCDDGSDEPEDCDKIPCEKGYFKCVKTGQCLPDAWMCDGQNDCADNDHTDEPESCKSATCEPTYHKCANNRCIPGRWKCDYRNDCGDNSDEMGCVPRNCSESEFKCERDQRCIAGHWRCNGETECEDGSDERNCTNLSCKPDEFQCQESKFCLPKSWVCDGKDDCVDNSDEQGCNATCSGTEFRCETSGQCIPASWQCDGTADCQLSPDDEKDCTKKSCPAGRVSCGDGACVPDSQVCDNVTQCQNSYDETNCTMTCTADQFKCTRSFQCVNKTQLCDYISDCYDNSDEDPHLCDTAYTRNCSKARCETGLCWTTPFTGSSFITAALNAVFTERCKCPNGTNVDQSGLKCQELEVCRQHGTCDQLCMPHKGAPWSYICHCEKGYYLTLAGKNRYCRAGGPEPVYVLMLAGDGLYSVDTTVGDATKLRKLGEDLESMDVQITDLGVTVFGVSGDSNHVTRVDVAQTRRRKRAVLKLTQTVTFPEAVSLRSVSVDWASERLYFTDPGAGTIGMADMDGDNRLTILNTNLKHVDQIRVNPYKNTVRIFWTQTGSHPRIESAFLDGSDRRLIAAHDLILPTDLAIDYPNQRLYWADVKKKSVETVNFDGSGRTVVKAFNITEDAPYKLDVFEKWLYVTTYTHRRLLKMDKFSRDPPQTLDVYQAGRPLAVHAVKQAKLVTACSSAPCGPGVMCVVVPRDMGYVCKCPNGQDLSGEVGSQSCSSVKPTIPYNCTDHSCLNGGTCRLDQRNTPKCHCPDNYTGDKCENDLCYGVCKHGDCRVVSGKPTCNCPLQYGGSQCEVDKCARFCNMNGQCLIDATGQPLCRCNYKFAGPRCNESKSDVCADYCLNGGTCAVDAQTGTPACTCTVPGTTGPRCSSCPTLACANDGQCLVNKDGTKICSCLRGYISSTSCQRSKCDDCKNGATCTWSGDEPRCNCSSSQFSGPQCENDQCHDFCQNGGTCSFKHETPSCTCPSGYKGRRCEEAATQCFNSFCKNGGSCITSSQSGNNDPYGSVSCQCLPGYGGKQCELITDCALLDCQNHGLCLVNQDNQGAVYCHCTAGWSGERCTKLSARQCMSYCFNEGLCHDCHMRDLEPVCGACKCHAGWTGDRCQTRTVIATPAHKNRAGITAAIAVPFVIVLVMLLGVAIYFIRKRRYHTKLFAHIRMSDTGASNVEINNPIYRPSQGGDEDESAFMFDGESATNFSNPLYGSPFGENAAMPTDERRELLENDQLKVNFAPDDDNANNRSSFA